MSDLDAGYIGEGDYFGDNLSGRDVIKQSISIVWRRYSSPSLTTIDPSLHYSSGRFNSPVGCEFQIKRRPASVKDHDSAVSSDIR